MNTLNGRVHTSWLAPISSKSKPLGSHMLVENIQFTRIPLSTMIGWTIGGRVHWKPSARKATCYPSDYYSGVRWLNLRIPLGSGLSHPSTQSIYAVVVISYENQSNCIWENKLDVDIRWIRAIFVRSFLNRRVDYLLVAIDLKNGL